MTSESSPTDADLRNQRQVIYWQLLASVFGMTDQAPNVEQLTKQLVEKLDLPALITEPNLSIDALLQRYPDLKPDFESIRKVCNPDEKDKEEKETTETTEEESLQPADLRRSLAYSKLLLNAFGPNTMTPNVTAAQYGQWCQDVGRFEECFGYAPGALRGNAAPPRAARPGRPGGRAWAGSCPRNSCRPGWRRWRATSSTAWPCARCSRTTAWPLNSRRPCRSSNSCCATRAIFRTTP